MPLDGGIGRRLNEDEKMNEDIEIGTAGVGLGAISFTLNLGWIMLGVIAVTVVAMLGYRAYKRAGGSGR